MNDSDYSCHYCNRNFTCKTALNRHKFGSCIWLYASKKEKLHETDLYEPIMSDNQRDMLIRSLLLQMTKMNDKIANLQREVSHLKQKQKVSILHFLNGSDRKPQHSIQQWIKGLVITQRHLELVFQKSLKDGIIQVILDELETMKLFQKMIPIKGYIQRPKTLYVYTIYTSNDKGPVLQWIKMETDMMKKLCTNIGARFYELYLQWQQENDEYLNSCEQAQEQDMQFMQKMLDDTYKTNVNMNSMLDRIYELVKVNFETIEYE